MPRPLVTIVTPTYNQERFVAACIESAQVEAKSGGKSGTWVRS